MPDQHPDWTPGPAPTSTWTPGPAPTPTPEPPARTWTDTAVDAIPAVTGGVGGIVGGIGGTAFGLGVGGVPGAVGGAVLGGGAGEALRQFVNRFRGVAAPTTGTDAAERIGVQGAVQGGAEATGAALGEVMNAAGPWMMQKALKPTAAMLSEYKTSAPKLVQTLLDEGVSVTQGGLDKLQKLFTATNDQIREAVANATGTIDKKNVAARVLPTAQKLSEQVAPAKDLQAVGDTLDEFLNHPTTPGPPTPPAAWNDAISVPDAQAMKVGTYRQVGKKYGEVSSAAIETQKALARGLKEEIASEVPQISGLNERDSQLMAALDAVGRRVALSGNKDPVGFAWVAQHPATFLAALFDRSPAVKSLVARGMYGAAGATAKVAPQLIRAAVTAAASSGATDASPPGGAP